MNEHPILFSTHMVRAIIDGKKTQTRRAMQPQPWYLPEAYDRFSGWMWTRDGTGDGVGLAWGSEADMRHVSHSLGVYCPYGKPGDQLWVRETWAALYPGTDDVMREVDPQPPICSLAYRATDERSINGNWRPSILMPRWASRITLEIVTVKVQRLQDISSQDAQSEGIEVDVWDQAIAVRDYSGDGKWFQSWADDDEYPYVDLDHIAQASFRTLWDHINGKRDGCTWDSNPWVWVVEFKLLPFRK